MITNRRRTSDIFWGRIILGWLCFSVCVLCADGAWPPEAPTGLLIELLSEPLGVENETPSISWIINDPDSNEHQTAYQVLVSDCPERLASDEGNMWDSGKAASGESSYVRYAGRPLKPDSIYYWKVRTWDKDDQQGAYSQPQRFTTAVKNAWTAIPVWGEADSNFLFLRTSFALPDKAIQTAIAHVTALSPEPAAQYVYKLYINGEFVGAGPERGFDGAVRYNTFDVTHLLRPGKDNVIGAVTYTTQDKRFLFQMTVIFTDGTRRTIRSDRIWKTLSGDSVYRDMGNSGHNSYYYAPREGLDARQYPFGWNDTGFDDAAWTNANEKRSIDKLHASSTRNTQQHFVKPTHVIEKGEGRFFIDFGKAVVAGIRLEVDGKAGRKVEIRLGEELSAPNTVRHRMRTENTYQEIWTLKDGRQTLENFGYRVFRYAELLNVPDGFDHNCIQAVVLRHPFDDNAAQFASSDPVLNDVWEFCKYSIKATALDVYVDTHTRERRNYEGDALINQLSHYCVDREYAFPRYSIEYLYYRPTWPTEYKLQSVMMAWYDYLYTGNPDSLRRHYDVLKTKTLEEFINDDSLVEKPENVGGQYGRDLVDWPDSQRDGYRFTRINTVINAFHYKAIDYLGQIAGVLGKTNEAGRYEERAKTLRRAVNEHLYDPQTGRFKDGKTANHHALHASAFALALDAVEPDKVNSVADYAAGRGMAVSVYGSHFLLEGLYRAGREEAALTLMNATEGNSWGHMMYNLGATIVGEAWDPSQKPNMSFSHAWASAPANAIPRGLFGVVPLEPGFRRFQIKPQPATLDRAALTVPSIRGSIGVEFRKNDILFEMTVQIPVNTAANVYVPVVNTSEPAIQMNGQTVESRIEDGFWVFDHVGSGRHRFLSR